VAVVQTGPGLNASFSWRARASPRLAASIQNDVGVRSATRESGLNQIEVGFTFEELHHLKRLFLRITDRLVVDGEIPKISVAIDPLDKISWPVYAMKHHVLRTKPGITKKRSTSKSLARLVLTKLSERCYSFVDGWMG
jgi:hypothetical protein